MSDRTISLYLKRPKMILKFFGIWPPVDNLNRIQLICHWMFTAFILTSQYSFLLFEFIYIANVFGDLDEVSDSSFLLFTQASLCYKTTVFIIYKDNLKILLDFMRSDTFAPHNKLHESRLERHALSIKRLSLFFFGSATITCSLWALSPLFNSGSRIFPFKIWMPVGPDHSPQYQLGYLYQMLAIYTSACLFSGVDGVTLAMIMFGCAQLDIIGDKLHTVQNVRTSSKLKPEERIQLIQDNNRIFIECVKQHQDIIRFIKIVEDTYHANIFFQLSGTVAIVCIIGLRISAAEPNSVQFITMLSYMVTMLAQLFLYCWCGQELTIRSEHLREWLYQCPWYEQNQKFKRSLWIAMERMKRPIIFRAGRYIPLSRPTFVSILRSSYSYFAVLNQASSK